MKYRHATGRYPEAMSELAARTDNRSGILASVTLEVLLPDLSDLSYDDVLAVRSSHVESLSRFRLEMARIAADLESTTLDRDLHEECLNQVAKTVIPAVQDLEADISQSRIEQARHILAAAGSTKPLVPFALAALGPLPLYAAALVSAGIISLDAALELKAARVNRKANGLAYVLDVAGSKRVAPQDAWNRFAAVSRIVGGD